MDIQSLLTAVLVGGLIGALGRLLVPGKQRIGCLLTLVVGVVAALSGTALSAAAGIRTDGFSLPEFGVQVLVAAFGVALLAGVLRRR